MRCAVIANVHLEVEAKDYDEWVSCLAEQTFHDHMRNAWQLYVDLGADRQRLARQVLGELEHIPRSGSGE